MSPSDSYKEQQLLVELRALLKTALEVASELGAGEDSRSSSPVAPDGSDD